MEDDATNRVIFDHCEIVHKYISSSNCVKKRQHLSGDLLEIGKGKAGGGGGACWLMISAKLLLRIYKTKDDATLVPHTALQFFKLVW